MTIGGEPVSTTVTPLASSRLSVVPSSTPRAAWRRTSSRRAERRYRVPVAAAARRAECGRRFRRFRAACRTAALRARTGTVRRQCATPRRRSIDRGRSTLAARELSTARTGPRQIVVFTTGADNGDPRWRGWSDELIQAGVLTCVVQTQPVDFWTRVVDRAGGSIVASQTGDVVTSFEELAATLEDQYLGRIRRAGAPGRCDGRCRRHRLG